jgi:hypothetical protein
MYTRRRRSTKGKYVPMMAGWLAGWLVDGQGGRAPGVMRLALSKSMHSNVVEGIATRGPTYMNW